MKWLAPHPRALAGALAIGLLAGCGGESAGEPARQAAAPEPAGSAREAPAAGSRCAPLDNPVERYDPGGKPMAFGFEYPGGWVVQEQFTSSGVSSIDIVGRIDPESRSPDFVFRIGHVVTKPNANAPKLVATWQKLPMVEGIEEVPVGGRTLYIAKTRMGEMIAYQALFPDSASETSAWLVSGGLPQVPDGCEEAAFAAFERLLHSLEPNPEIGAPPE